MVVAMDIIGLGLVELTVLPNGTVQVRRDGKLIGSGDWEKRGDRIVMRQVPALYEPPVDVPDILDASCDTDDVLVFRLAEAR